MKTFAEIMDTAGRSKCENALYKVFVNMLFPFQKRKFSSELREYSLELCNCKNFRVLVITLTNCRNVKSPWYALVQS